jgi:hypothetical protein
MLCSKRCRTTDVIDGTLVKMDSARLDACRYHRPPKVWNRGLGSAVHTGVKNIKLNTMVASVGYEKLAGTSEIGIDKRGVLRSQMINYLKHMKHQLKFQ